MFQCCGFGKLVVGEVRGWESGVRLGKLVAGEVVVGKVCGWGSLCLEKWGVREISGWEG